MSFYPLWLLLITSSLTIHQKIHRGIQLLTYESFNYLYILLIKKTKNYLYILIQLNSHSQPLTWVREIIFPFFFSKLFLFDETSIFLFLKLEYIRYSYLIISKSHKFKIVKKNNNNRMKMFQFDNFFSFFFGGVKCFNLIIDQKEKNDNLSVTVPNSTSPPFFFFLFYPFFQLDSDLILPQISEIHCTKENPSKNHN